MSDDGVSKDAEHRSNDPSYGVARGLPDDLRRDGAGGADPLVEAVAENPGDWVADRLSESIALNPDCCGNDQWRGHYCQYHQGFEDGLWAAVEAML